MSNIINHNFSNVKIKLNSDNYYDYFINDDNLSAYNINYFNDKMYDDCLITYIDMSSNKCVDGIWLNGDEKYYWDEYVNNSPILNNIGYTGVDNGLINYKRDRISNKYFFDVYTESSYKIGSSNTIRLHQVNGTHNLYDYPITIQSDKIKFNGGFYQGFFKTKCNEYQVLPSNFKNGDVYNFEFYLNKQDFEKESNKTLNDKNPHNKGIFFYIGTRSENKWDYFYSGDDDCFTLSPDDYIEDSEIDKNTHIISNFNDVNPYIEIADNFYISSNDDELLHNSVPNGVDRFFGDDYLAFDGETLCVEDYDYIENEVDISQFEFETKDGFQLKISGYEYFDTDNKFLFFNRTKDGFTTKTWDDNDKIRFVDIKNTFNDNLFLIMNRTKDGYTTKTIELYREQFKAKYDVNKDLFNNALAFRVTDDGRIGYRYLTFECGEGMVIKEGYSKPNIIMNGKWYTINVKIKFYQTTMKLFFYINGALLYITNELPKIMLRTLNDLFEKQEGVPYNISIGGGTQGLCETVLPNYMLTPYRTYPLEKYFAGTFIGYIKSFKIYNCDIEHFIIKNNSEYNK